MLTTKSVLVTHNVGKVELSHRYRVEQRMLGNAATGEFANGRYENRVRYMAKLTVDITKGDKPVYLAFYDEIFLNFGKEVAYNIFDQNRLYGAVGMTLLPDLKLEVGYMYRLIQLRSLDFGVIAKNRIENNHTLQLGLFHTASFFQKD